MGDVGGRVVKVSGNSNDWEMECRNGVMVAWYYCRETIATSGYHVLFSFFWTGSLSP